MCIYKTSTNFIIPCFQKMFKLLSYFLYPQLVFYKNHSIFYPNLPLLADYPSSRPSLILTYRLLQPLHHLQILYL